MESSKQLLLSPDKWTESSGSGLSVVTFNTLRRNYQFNGKYYVPQEVRDWNARIAMHQKLLGELNADIVCLQEAEVATFEEDFGFMIPLGYTAVNPVAKDDKEHGHTKPSIFFKTSKLKLLWHNPRSRTVLVSLEEIESGRQFYLVNCHLQGGQRGQDQRCFQLRSALQQIVLHARSNKIAADQLICFLCGDFNASPEEPVHALIVNGHLSHEENEKDFKGSFKFQHNYKFQDSYQSIADRPYTFKWGVKEDAVFQTIDYIYFTPNTVEVQCLRDPLTAQQREELFDRLGLPNTWNPSDHLPTAAVFKFRE